MAKTDFKNMNEYHATQPKEAQERMQAIRDVIHEVVPGVEETISYQIPCFKYLGYLIYYSAHTRHISLSYPYTPQFLAAFATELREYKVSRSAIQFPADRPLPLDLIRRIILFRKAENEAAPKKKK
ncbi:hypothetical protein GCM10023093_00830 [Nemorincola caseinilytica]|uniref:YdhG-like domain-containing protein n=1 Tax=Nemorincola caseinilytica TaxID=2054315 RepID=A0ABP8N5F1_9BACT